MNTPDAQTFFRKRLAIAKIPYAARRVPREVLHGLVRDAVTPCPGDLVLVRIAELGQHKYLELANGRRARLFPGDEVVLVYGNRYAPDQFEAEVPADLGPCHMAAAGGIAALVLSKHPKMSAPTAVEPVGLLIDALGNVVNLERFALREITTATTRPLVVAVVGTSMNAGKTETATHIVRGLDRAGLRVGAAKVTGTGAGPDAWSMLDAGAFRVLDFGDAGLPSTYLAGAARVEAAFRLLVKHLAFEGADVIVLEVADGVFQPETAQLLRSQTFGAHVDTIVFASGDATGSAHGVQWLREASLPVRALCGLVSASPLASREAARATRLPVLTLEQLREPSVAALLGVSVPEAQTAERAAG